MSKKSNLAKENFSKNCNCCQAVILAFAKDFEITEELAMKIGCGFGGGARDKELCGAVSGALMALGLKYGQKNFDDIEGKNKTYELTIEFNKRFKKLHGSIVCKDLKDADKCSELVGDATKIVQEML